MRRFVLGWKKLGHEKRLKAYIINYADDLVICCRGRADEALILMRNMMSKLKLTVNYPARGEKETNLPAVDDHITLVGAVVDLEVPKRASA
jgi:hypothetical protein